MKHNALEAPPGSDRHRPDCPQPARAGMERSRSLPGLLFWNGKEARRSLSGLGFGPNPSAEVLHRLTADSKTASRPGILRPVQALEHSTNPVQLLWLDADAIVLHRKQPPPAGCIAGRAARGRHIN